jgi:polar amino acid transport system substrate-binding protein
VDSAAAALVPAAIKAKGAITIATDPSYPPNESKDQNGNIVGWDVDMGNAIAAKLGLKANFTEVTFDDIVTGISTGKYDAGMSSITDNKKREGVDDFVTYFNAGTKLMVPKGNPKHLTDTSPTDLSLCGLTIGVEKGTVQEDPDIPTRSKACTAAGKPAIKALSQDTQDQINESLSSGRCDAVLADSPVVDYYAKSGNFEAVGDLYSGAPYGIAISKSNSGLSQAFLAALKDLVADGTYHQLTSKYGIQSGDYTTPGLNQATS